MQTKNKDSSPACKWFVCQGLARRYDFASPCYSVISTLNLKTISSLTNHHSQRFDTFCPLGPCLVTNIKNPNNLNIKTTVNDITLQNSNTNDLIFNVQELISFLSQGTTLAKGSIILTGTPEGVGFARDPPLWLKQGDSVEVAVEDIGILCNRIEEE